MDKKRMNAGFSAIWSLGPSVLFSPLKRTSGKWAAPPGSSTIGPKRLGINSNQTFTAHLYEGGHVGYFKIKTTLKKRNA